MNERNLYQQKLALFVLDMLAFFGALNIAIWLRYSANLPFAKGGPAPWREIFIAFPFVAATWLFVGAMSGTYRIRQSTIQEISAIVRSTLLTFLAVLSATFYYRGFSYSRGMISFFIPTVIIAVICERLLFRALRRRALIRFAGRSKIAILGQGNIGNNLIKSLRRDKEYYEIVGYIQLNEPEASQTNIASENELHPPLPVLGRIDQLDNLCEKGTFDTIILVNRRLPEHQVLEAIEICLKHQVTWNLIPAVHELLIDRARVNLVDGIPLVGMRRTNIVGFNWMMKRIFDIVVSFLVLLLTLPLMIIVAIGIKLTSKGPIFYTQKRVGYRGQTFSFYKFRSMHIKSDDNIHREYTRKWIENGQAHSEQNGEEVHKIVNDPRIFKLGKFIRKFSIDELPQLLNVLRGDMSLIGPRPALMYEVDVYREWHRRRFEAPPGITGLWQVSGRNQLSFEEMIKLDIDYLENWSFLLDVQILWRTVRVVLFGSAY